MRQYHLGSFVDADEIEQIGGEAISASRSSEKPVDCPNGRAKHKSIIAEIAKGCADSIVADNFPVFDIISKAGGGSVSEKANVNGSGAMFGGAFGNGVDDIPDGVSREGGHQDPGPKSGGSSRVDIAQYQPVQEVRFSRSRRT
ncbi:hypothetical protein ASD32_25860 [Rhizobium sp. Root483D2]|nr:hypothetical protein ASD32_25860 [Rhizobium sp. Root483D2]